MNQIDFRNGKRANKFGTEAGAMLRRRLVQILSMCAKYKFMYKNLQTAIDSIS